MLETQIERSKMLFDTSSTSTLTLWGDVTYLLMQRMVCQPVTVTQTLKKNILKMGFIIFFNFCFSSFEAFFTGFTRFTSKISITFYLVGFQVQNDTSWMVRYQTWYIYHTLVSSCHQVVLETKTTSLQRDIDIHLSQVWFSSSTSTAPTSIQTLSLFKGPTLANGQWGLMVVLSCCYLLTSWKMKDKYEELSF